MRNPTFSHFDTIPECDRQTDRRKTTAYTALGIESRNKNAKRRIMQITPHDSPVTLVF